MFRQRKLDISIMYSNGRITRFYFGWAKPYPKVKTVKVIVKMAKKYMEQYSKAKIPLIGDGLSTVQIENEYGIKRQINGKDVSPQDPDVRAMHTILPRGQGSVIEFNTYCINKLCNWNFCPGEVRLNKDIGIKAVTEKEYVQYIFIHEFAHALDYSYNLSGNGEIIKIYKQYEDEYTDIKEFIAESFVVSESYKQNQIANQVREIIENVVLLEKC